MAAGDTHHATRHTCQSTGSMRLLPTGSWRRPMAADGTHHTQYHVSPTPAARHRAWHLARRLVPTALQAPSLTAAAPRVGSSCAACPTTPSDRAPPLSILLQICTGPPHTPVWGYRDVASPRLGSVSSFHIEFGIPFCVLPLAKYRHDFSVLPALAVNSHAFPAKRT